MRRTFDIMGSAFLLVLTAPLIAFLALLIKLQDGGPALYRRHVVGPAGEFDAFKLRSMRPDADQVLGRDPVLRRKFEVNFKLRHDPRVTPLGAVLRKLSLDELPQLFNVLRGEMSLVGPRMITPAELERHREAGWVFRTVKPGLTGYWQVYGRQSVSYEQRIAMDVFYVNHRSFLLDVKILMRTPLRVVRGAGAY